MKPSRLIVSAIGCTLLVVSCGVSVHSRTTDPPAASSSPAPPRSAGVSPWAVGVLHNWDAARARAWAAGDVVALRGIYAPRSSAGKADVTLLQRYLARGLVVRRMRMQVLSAVVITARSDFLRIRVTDRLASAVAVGTQGVLPLPQDHASTRMLVFRNAGRAWLLVSSVSS